MSGLRQCPTCGRSLEGSAECPACVPGRRRFDPSELLIRVAGLLVGLVLLTLIFWQMKWIDFLLPGR